MDQLGFEVLNRLAQPFRFSLLMEQLFLRRREVLAPGCIGARVIRQAIRFCDEPLKIRDRLDE